MGLENELARIRNEARAADEELAARLEKRLDLAEHRIRQLDHRIRLLEQRWFMQPAEPLDESPDDSFRRSPFRRAKIPRRPKAMRAFGDGEDPPEGGAQWTAMI
jgi:hypothetical protein